MKYNDTTRRRLAADTAQPSPRGTGRKITLDITLYEGGHSTLNSVPRAQPVMSNDDVELVAQFALLLRSVRRQVA